MYHADERSHPSEEGSTPLDQEVWRAWQEKNRFQEQQRAITRMKAVKWVCIAVLLVTAVLLTQLSLYHLVLRFAVALGAFVVMMQGLRRRDYVFAALFAATVVIYNPFVPTFLFAGGWQRLFVFASVLPFLASLAQEASRAPSATKAGN